MRISLPKLLLLFAVGLFAGVAKAQTLYTSDIYTSGALSVRVTAAHPCEAGANEGAITFVVLTSTGTAKLQVGGPINLFTQTPIPPAGYTHNPTNTLPPGVYNYLIVDDKNTIDPLDDDVINSTGFSGPFPSVTLVDLTAISLSEDLNTANSSCTTPDGQIMTTISGGSKTLPSGGGYTYTLTRGVTTVASGATTGATALSFTGLQGGTYNLSINDDYSSCGGSRSFVVANPPAPAAPTGGTGASYCQGQTIPSISVTAPTAPEVIDWYSASTGGASLVTGASFTPSGPGTYHAETRNSTTGCVSATRLAVTLTELPLPTASVSGGGTVCSTDPLPTVTITLTGALPFDVTYDTPGGNVTLNDYNSNTIVINNAAAGDYEVLSLVDNGGAGCTATSLGSTITVTVVTAPTATVSASPGVLCAGQGSSTLTFTLSGTAPFTINYTDGSSPFSFTTSSTTHTVTVSPTTSTTYIITGVDDATICAGATGSSTTVTVNTPPSAAALVAVGATTICAGQSATLRVNVTGGTPGYDFTLNGIAAPFTDYVSAADITVSPTSTSTYSFSTNVADDNGCTVVGTGSVTITVNQLPTASISGGGTVCSGATLPNVQFTFTGTGPFDFTYSNGSGTFNVDDHPSTTFTIFNAPAGTYSVTALVDQGGAGCTATSLGGSAAVVVTPLTTPTLSGPPPPEICQRTSVTFTTEASKTNYNWTFTGTGLTVLAGGSATDNSVTVSWSATGAKTVNVTYTDNGCTSQLGTKAITVRARPNLTLTGPTSVCEGSTGNVYTAPNGLSNYIWSVSPGGTITAGGGTTNRTVTITWGTVGAQSVSVNASNGFACTDDTPPTVAVTVNAIPSGQISGSATICSGTGANLTFTLPVGTFNVVYTDGSSSFNANGISSGATVSVSPTSTRTYTITSITDATSLCVVTAPNAAITGSAVITVLSSPSAALTVAPQSPTICSGTATNILVSSSEMGVSYQLRDNSNNSNVGSAVAGTGAQISLPTGNLSSTTTFNVFASLAGCSAQLTQLATVNVDVAPNLNLVVGSTIDPVCSGGSSSITVQASETGATYQLRNGTTNIGTAVAGTGATISLPTGALAATTTFNILVTKGVCTPVQLVATPTITVNGAVDGGLVISAQTSPVCSGSGTNIQITASEMGVNYQLRNDADDSLIGSAVPGNGGTIDLPTGNLTVATTFNVLASSGTCSIEMTQTVSVAITALPNVGLTVAAQASSVCPSGSTNIQVQASESGVSYQLRNDADDSLIGTAVVSAGGTINLPTSSLTSATTFNVLATRGTCSLELTQTATVSISPVPAAGLTVTPQVPAVCAGAATSIDISLSQVGVSYQLRNDADDSAVGSPAVGNGATISLPTSSLTTNTTFNVLATLGSCSAELTQTATVNVNPVPSIALAVAPQAVTVCTGTGTNIQITNSEMGVDYQLRNNADNTSIGSPVTGTGLTIDLPTGNLTAAMTYNVLAQLGTCSAQLTQTASVSVAPLPSASLGVSVQTSPICAGTGTNVQIALSQSGVSYQLRNDADDSLIGSAVSGTGGTIDLPTGSLLATTTFNVFATLGTCSIELTQTANVVTVPGASALLAVDPQDAAVCTGSATNILVATSEMGVTYQLRNDADDSPIGTAVVGDGSTLSLPTNTLSANTTFNVLATSATCSIELTDKATVTVDNVPNASLVVSATTPVCAGQSSVVSVVGSETGVSYQLRIGSTNVGSAVAGTGGTIGLSTGALALTTTFNVLATRGVCTPVQLTNTVLVNVNPIAGDQTTAGTETWLAYVYNDSATPGVYDFDPAKYRGVLSEADLLNLRPGIVTYNSTSDAFHMHLANSFPVQGPNVCGSFLDFYSLRFKMDKAFAQGVYTFNVGADDGVRLYIDGAIQTLTETSGGSTIPWGLHGYTEFQTAGICLTAGTHELVIEYFEQGGTSRLSFDFNQVGAPSVSTPVSVCVNSTPPPTLSATGAGATGYAWYSDSGLTNLVASTQDYTPSAAELDLATVGQTTFFAVATYGCGQSPASAVVVDVISSATLTTSANPFQVCQSGSLLDLTNVVTASPTGGTIVFAGTGVAGNNFDASQAVGTYTLTADYTTGSCSAPTLTFDVEIINDATLTVPATATTVCELTSVDLLTLVSATPSGGTFTFSNITGGTPVPIVGGQFDPAGLSGTINIQVDYAAGTCTDSKTFDLNIISTPTLATQNTVICPGGGLLDLTDLVTVSPAGGSFTFTGSSAISGNSLDPSALGGTTVNINVVYDIGSGCVVSSVTPIAVQVKSSTDPTCGIGGCTIIPTLSKTDATCAGISDGSITIASVFGGTGPYEISINNGVSFQPITAFPSTIPSLAGANYSVIVRDNASCVSSATPIIIENVTTITGTVVKIDASCAGGDGSIQITTPVGGTAPYQFSIDGGLSFPPQPIPDTFSDLGIGSYNVVVMDANGCVSSIIPVAIASPTNCNGSGGTGTCATVVIVPKPSPATCTNSDGEVVFSIKPFVPAINNTGVKISITGISPTNQTISRTIFNDTTFLALPIGTYDYSIEYGDVSCTKTGQVTIDRSGTIGVPIVTDLVNPTCFGTATGAATIDVPGETGNQLEWSLDGTLWNSFIAGNQVIGIPAGDNVISVRRNSTDPCASGALVSLTEPEEISTSLTTTNATCNNNDGAIAVGTITGGTAPYTFELNGSVLSSLPTGDVFASLSAGNYTLTIIDAVGCSEAVTTTITFPGFVNHDEPVVTVPDCTGAGANGVIQFQITDVGSFLFAYTTDPVQEPAIYNNAGNNTVTIPDLSNGTYYIWIRPNGSTAQCATKLNPVSISGVFPVSAAAATADVSCFGEKASILISDISGAPGVDYAYTLTNTVDNLTSTGSITATQALGEFTIPDVVPGSYSLVVSQNQTALVASCTNPILASAIAIQINSPEKALDTLYVKRHISLPDLATGSVLIGIDPSGSEPYEARIELTEPILPSQSYLVDWTPVNMNLQNLQFEHTFGNVYGGVYTIGIRDAGGCEKAYVLSVGIDMAINIPNIFTPNGDGVNELFYIRNLPSDASLVITNRWGKEVFKSGSYQNDWDGGDAADGVYFYRLSMPNESVTGWVEILRGN